MAILFEEIKERDLSEVKNIYDWYIEHSTATFHTEPIQIDQLKEFIYINHSIYKSYLIYLNKGIVGYCFLTYYNKRQAYNRTAEITVYLKPEFCNQGIGKIALNHLETKAKENGLRNLIGIIAGDNEWSITLLEKSGFIKCAHYKNVGEKFNKILDVVAFQKEI
ncbi:MAG: GNAT family N-acetyltransferase [Bacteroidetes bacterium]|nr:GNAT family N-acetyltransferase [Bacteroidota bacterium]